MQLTWLSEPEGAEDYCISAEELTARPATAGFLNLIHPNRVQILGAEEIDYLTSQDEGQKQATVRQMLEQRPLAVIVGDGLDMPAEIAAEAKGGHTALMRSELKTHELVDYLQYHISRSLAKRTTLHGVFMEVFTIGVLITGGPGSGKSELALELLNRGHHPRSGDVPG